MPQPKDKDWLNGLKKKMATIYAVYKRHTSTQGTLTDWKWRAEKRFQANEDQKKVERAILISDKIDFWNEGCEKRQKTLHHDQRINPWRRYNNYKYIQTQHRSTTICKEMLTSMKGEINSNTIIVGDFNTILTPMDRSTKQEIGKGT